MICPCKCDTLLHLRIENTETHCRVCTLGRRLWPQADSSQLLRIPRDCAKRAACWCREGLGFRIQGAVPAKGRKQQVVNNTLVFHHLRGMLRNMNANYEGNYKGP